MIVDGSYNLWLVVLSYLISVCGSFTALQLAAKVRREQERDGWVWLSVASVALGGCGIWAMHFIAMLAFTLPGHVNYDILLTMGSMVLAIVIVGIGLNIVTKSVLTFQRLILGGTVVGLGVCGMHYMGMAAMRMPGKLSYTPGLFTASVVIAIVAASAALWLMVKLEGLFFKAISAFVMGIAVCGMHYTGMAATVFTMDEGHTMVQSTTSSVTLAFGIASVTIMTLAVSLCALILSDDSSRKTVGTVG